MLYDSPHAQEGLGQKTRRISHGPAIRHQQPLRPDLQLGRNGSEPSRNVDRRCSLRAGNDRLKFLGFRDCIHAAQSINLSRVRHYRGAQEWRLVYHGLSQNVGPSDLALLLLEGEGAIRSRRHGRGEVPG